MIPQKDPPPEMLVTGVPLPSDEADEHYPSNLPAERSAEEIQVLEDMCWASDDPEIERLYEGKIIAVHQRRVIAVGDDWKTVTEEGERVSGLPGNLFAVVFIPDTASFFGCH